MMKPRAAQARHPQPTPKRIDTAAASTEPEFFSAQISQANRFYLDLKPPATERLRKLPVTEIIATNTIPVPTHKMLPNLKVISIAGLLSEVILRVHEGRSVGELFNE